MHEIMQFFLEQHILENNTIMLKMFVRNIITLQLHLKINYEIILKIFFFVTTKIKSILNFNLSSFKTRFFLMKLREKIKKKIICFRYYGYV